MLFRCYKKNITRHATNGSLSLKRKSVSSKYVQQCLLRGIWLMKVERKL